MKKVDPAIKSVLVILLHTESEMHALTQGVAALFREGLPLSATVHRPLESSNHSHKKPAAMGQSIKSQMRFVGLGSGARLEDART
jgi:hypothetical protein